MLKTPQTRCKSALLDAIARHMSWSRMGDTSNLRTIQYRVQYSKVSVVSILFDTILCCVGTRFIGQQNYTIATVRRDL